jgi:hypothetical protein
MPIRRRYMLAGVLVAIGVALLLTREAGQTDHAASIHEWRAGRLQRLTADDGWLAVAGLFWLKEGDNRAGTGPGNDILLPAGSAPEVVGVFAYRDGRVTFTADPGAAVTVDGKPVTTLALQEDPPGPSSQLAINDLTLFVIKRGDRRAIRLRDRNRQERKQFEGLTYFPIDRRYRVVADWVPYDPPKTLSIPNVLGQIEELPCPGYARFTLEGQAMRIEPVIEQPGDTELFVLFRDATAGIETYGAGRFLYTPMPEGGKIVIDFNKAYNPPCAFTPYATCPLPPPQNVLPVRIEAGEKNYGAH